MSLVEKIPTPVGPKYKAEHPAERIPSNWHITEAKDGNIHVRNLVTNRELSCTRAEFKELRNN